MTLGSKLRYFRKARGLTQKDLGDKVHKSSQVISNLERGYTQSLDALDIAALAKALEIEPSELFSDFSSSVDVLPSKSSNTPAEKLADIILSGAPDSLREKIAKLQFTKNGEIIDADAIYKLTDAQKLALCQFLEMALEAAERSGKT